MFSKHAHEKNREWQKWWHADTSSLYHQTDQAFLIYLAHVFIEEHGNSEGLDTRLVQACSIFMVTFFWIHIKVVGDLNWQLPTCIHCIPCDNWAFTLSAWLISMLLLSCRYPEASPSTPIWISNLACDLSEHLTIYHCPRSTGGSCNHSQDVQLQCSSPFPTRMWM